ncbi:trypsin-like peptidase domain-containing protein [Streptomyces sp. NPDC048297]|uniref:VMAP-C domain-containing protein n=1 Tax=Streptomyces sp. NPDC048297 TaxID=3365531 RepID=UPI0037191BF9
MTERYDGGAPDGFDAAQLALRELVLAATVRIHHAGAGYAHDEPGSFLGSGFFVAPNWVLTCAHVIHAEEGGKVTVVYRTSPYEDPRAVPGAVAVTLPERVGTLVQGGWPAPDLALVRLSEPVGHACVYVSERPNPHFGGNRVYYAGWTGARGRLEILDGYLSVEGTISAWSPEEQVRLGQNELPPGVSGGPVIDPVRGEVVGVLKSRSDHGTGGTSIGIEQLRTLQAPSGAPGVNAASGVNAAPGANGATAPPGTGQAAAHADPRHRSGTPHHRTGTPHHRSGSPQHPNGTPHPDIYQAVVHAHDRYHRDRQQPSDSPDPTWADIQGELGARPGRTLSPHERGELLGRLADLPPPASTHALLGMLRALPNFRLPSLVPAPRGWRDGLGVLYEHARQDGARRLVIDYAMGILAAERERPPSVRDAERALWDWVSQASRGLDSSYRTELALRRAELLGRPHPGHERTGTATGFAPAPAFAPGSAPAPAPVHGSAPGQDPPEHPAQPSTQPSTQPSAHPSAQLPSLAPLLAPPGPSVLLVVLCRGWEPDHCDWSISVADKDGATTLLHETQRTPLAGLDSHVAAPLTEAFRQCDEPGAPAALYVALPHQHLDTAVDGWRLRSDGVPLGVERPVLVRCSDRDQLPDEGAQGPGAWPAAVWEPYDAEDGEGDEDGERRDRWRRLHVRQAQAEVLDCDDGVRRPVPDTATLRGLAPHTVPVLCRLGDLRYASDPGSLGRILRAGVGVAMWRHWRRQPESVCGEFHRGVKAVVDDGAGVALLPEAVHGLREQMHAGLTEAFWAHGVALLYDDPHRPLPGTGDLLEAP